MKTCCQRAWGAGETDGDEEDNDGVTVFNFNFFTVSFSEEKGDENKPYI